MMSRNPYSPPTASVADPPPPVATPRPREATLAVRLLWLSFALGLGTGLVRQSWAGVMEWVIGLISIGLYGALIAWLILKVGRGRNWARITYTVLLVLSYVSILTSWSTYAAAYRGHPEMIVLDGIDTLADLGGLYFMFTKPANAWFRPEKSHEAT
jgi:hypothetical protein